ncbi:D-alanyl-D-alanine carboxypeptidase/D-alanyl-D-alanine endopeptidase [Kutzneria albida]|uniref:Serine-type D-Ala-D-Ala carboxypeptidase n=1 Tax=Kutzneria albida DSM 43870 TaxID=1449976 RepID=W5WGN5_9PSEU|nr:D-alanyl-D-alanine carboxypeptidase/D-alanyl-D-alanine-endopeptidase [Kutzneria albida]AHI00359.1 hypothetical protein KALB_7001 [Kutzneria albida DSM 43870]
MRIRPRHVAAICVAAAVLVLPGAASADNANNSALGKDLDALLGDASLRGGQVGLVVRDADTGSVLYSRQGDSLLLPASTNKLFTSAAALEVLGPDYTFSTTVSGTGRRVGSVLIGDLYLKGTGDPTLLAKDYQDLAAKVAASGVRTVLGDLVADDTWFDSVRLGPSWAWDDEPYYYSAPVSALTVSPDTDYDAGSITVKVTPGVVGQPAKVELTPATDAVRVVDTATTSAAGTSPAVVVDRPHGSDTITVSGTIPAGGAAANEFMAAGNPTAVAASVFRKALADNGVRVVGGTSFRATPAEATRIADRKSIPLSQLQVPFLKLSNNMHAEILTKAAGRKVHGQGTWDAGLRALGDKLTGLGVDPAAMQRVDGSGLSRMDLVSSGQLTALLVAAKGRPWFQSWYEALPIAGNSERMVGGTLRNRLVGTPAANNLHAKTGSMTGVSGLSGYVTAANGQKLVFSLLENNFLAGSVRSVEDAVALRLATYNGAADTAQPRLAPRVSPQHAPADRRTALECGWTKSC